MAEPRPSRWHGRRRRTRPRASGGGFAPTCPRPRALRATAIATSTWSAHRRCHGAPKPPPGPRTRASRTPKEAEVSSDFSSRGLRQQRGILRQATRAASHALFSEPTRPGERVGMQRDYWMTRVARKLADLEAPEAVGRQLPRERAAAPARRALRVPTCEAPSSSTRHGAESALASGRLRERLCGVPRIELPGRTGSARRSRARRSSASSTTAAAPADSAASPSTARDNPRGRNVVVDRGRLETWLLDGYSARKLGNRIDGQRGPRRGGSAADGGNHQPVARAGRVRPRADRRDTDGLAGDGAHRHGLQPGHGRLLARRQRASGSRTARLTHPVEEITIAGNLGDMLAAIDAHRLRALLWRGLARALDPRS